MSALEQAVPDGFKHTDIGIIPKDWTFSALRDVLKESPKYGINAAAIPLQGSLPVYIRITDISEDGYFSPSEKVGVNSPFSELYKLRAGEIVLARTGASVGKSYLYRERDGELVYAGFLIKVSPKSDLLNPEFLFQYLKTEQYWAWVTVNSMRSGQPGINGNEYGSLLVPLPKIEEQTAIANALSDVDALLTELEKLIAKKQAIKTATMQQLLTGKTRLPQFAIYTDGAVEGKSQGQPKGTKPSELGEIPEDWDVYKLPDVVWYQEGPGLRKWQFKTKGLKVINVTNLQQNGFLDLDKTDRHVSWDEYEKTYKHFACDEDDLVIASSGNSYCKSSTVRKCDLPLLMNTSVIRFKPIGDFSKGFMDVYLKSPYFKDQIDLLITGGAQPNFGPAHLDKIKIPAPSNPEEQTAIATILSDMDNEIQTLDQRLAKTRQIKQGMMQELLTGRTRLPF